jgi:hypothetical protein
MLPAHFETDKALRNLPFSSKIAGISSISVPEKAQDTIKLCSSACLTIRTIYSPQFAKNYVSSSREPFLL